MRRWIRNFRTWKKSSRKPPVGTSSLTKPNQKLADFFPFIINLQHHEAKQVFHHPEKERDPQGSSSKVTPKGRAPEPEERPFDPSGHQEAHRQSLGRGDDRVLRAVQRTVLPKVQKAARLPVQKPTDQGKVPQLRQSPLQICLPVLAARSVPARSHRGRLIRQSPAGSSDRAGELDVELDTTQASLREKYRGREGTDYQDLSGPHSTRVVCQDHRSRGATLLKHM